MELNDLFEAAKKGNDCAEKDLFSVLLVRFRLIAYRVVRDKKASEDVAHDAVVRVLQSYKELEIHSSFAGWAYTVVRRQALRFMEKQKKEQNVFLESSNNRNYSPNKGTGSLLEEKILKCLQELSSKDKRYARILNLKQLGFGFEEICLKLKIKRNNAYIILHRARKLMESCLGIGDGAK